MRGKAKLDKWADLLLDTGKRNNLINFRDTSNSTAEILWPSPAILFDKMNRGNTVLEVYDPKLAEQDYPKENNPDSQAQFQESDIQNDKDAYLARYSAKLKKQSQLLLYNHSAASPIKAIRNINKRARAFIEETGVNVAYMAFGFVYWKEKASSREELRAPILLVPIQLVHDSVLDPYYIKPTEDDVIVNPTFAYKLDVEYGIKLPDYDDERLKDYLEKISKLVKKLQWTVSLECKLGIFSFLKINMYRDLKDNASIILRNENVRRLLGESVKGDGANDKGDENSSTTDPLTDLYCVVDADSSQIAAIEAAKSGKSFVLQGPPGTGKSQTITNIITECLGDGKKVLFVSEKLAALNVVYDKLKQAGLSEFCLELHSHKANKKNVIDEICHTLRTARSSVSAKADKEIAIKEKARKQLDEYADELHKQRPILGKSLYQMYESYSVISGAPDMKWVIPHITDKSEEYLSETVLLLEQYADLVPSVGYDYKKNPWYGYINPDTSFQEKDRVREELEKLTEFLLILIPILEQITERYKIPPMGLKKTRIWRDFFRFASSSQIITPSLLQEKNFKTIYAAIDDLESQNKDTLLSRQKIETVCDDGIYKISGAEYHKKLTGQFGGTFSRLFNSEYKQLIKDLQAHKLDRKKPCYDEAVALTEQLADCQQKTMNFEKAEEPFKTMLGPAYKGLQTEWSYIREQMDELKLLIETEVPFEKVIPDADFNQEKEFFTECADKLDHVFSTCDVSAMDHISKWFEKDVLDIAEFSCEYILKKCDSCLNTVDNLDSWCRFRDLFLRLDEKRVVPYIDKAIKQNFDSRLLAEAFQKQFYMQWIYAVSSNVPILSTFSRVAQDKAVKTFAEKDVEQFEINKAKIREILSAKRPSLDMVAPGSSLAVLLREGEKKRKQKSIRILLAETGELVSCIKPCFLMSPLSVSTFLPADTIRFDVVIFDEASQIFPQDAIGAIYRAKQLIVVGDSKQMPPSNFFNSTVETENEDEETEDVTDFESILDLCSVSMQQYRLRWHYRSRYEELIAFSNINFYDGTLITFPSSKTKSLGNGVDYYYVDGIYDRKTRTNEKEAEFIVDLIYRDLEEHPERSLGVVAFNIAQQALIDNALTNRRQSMPEKEYLFKNNDKEPIFIKNLETVQGDERDTILFSIAYGTDIQGRLLHNFGPLNRAGGERRLNVAATRAKCNVQLVSSMHYSDIDLKRTASKGARLLKEYLDFAENGNIAFERVTQAFSFETKESDFEKEIKDFLCSKGYRVNSRIGCSEFKIDIGLKASEGEDFALAIECDGAAYRAAGNTRDRDRLRKEVLEKMGWSFYRVWSTAWFHNPSDEQTRLMEAANDALRNLKEEDKTKSEKKAEQVVSFESTVAEEPPMFPLYKAVDTMKLKRRYYPNNFVGMVKEILNVEAPLSEELLMKRIAWWFGKSHVTNSLRAEYEERMSKCQREGIIRRNGFLYLKDAPEVQFRCLGDIERNVKQIAPEELAAGMLTIVRQNGRVDKGGLYRSVAAQCGVSRVSKTTEECFDKALETIGKLVVVSDNMISLKAR